MIDFLTLLIFDIFLIAVSALTCSLQIYSLYSRVEKQEAKTVELEGKCTLCLEVSRAVLQQQNQLILKQGDNA